MNASASLQQPSLPKPGAFPVLVEAKSTGDFTNTKKRRKEEAQKIALLKAKYGESIGFNLFLCGHFDTGNLAPPRVRETERKRGEIQLALDAESTSLERNQVGRFATPPELA